MGAWACIIDLVGEPAGRWPDHCDHLNYRDRMRLIVFLFENGVSPELIKELASCTQIYLLDASAEMHWTSLAQACANDNVKAFRAQYYARDLISGDVVHLDGRVEYNAPSCTVVTPNGNVDMRQYEIDAFADCGGEMQRYYFHLQLCLLEL